MSVEKLCQNCGFSYRVGLYRKDSSKFCSYQCYWGKSTNLKEKACGKCKETLSIHYFGKVNRGWNSNCKECRRKDWKNWSRKNDAKNRFRFYEWNAKRNSRNFEMTLEQFTRLVEESECFYCGNKEERLGLDRVDNSKGYSMGNVVAACRRCNIAKSDMSQKDFIQLCARIFKKHAIT